MAIYNDQWVGPATFEAAVSEHDGSRTVMLLGELDIAAAATLREVLAEQILDAVTPRVHVDLSGLAYLDSSGIGVLVAACKRVRASEGSFSMTSGGGPARRILEIAGLIDFLEVDHPA
jgi:anti-sigma B factor antagonist